MGNIRRYKNIDYKVGRVINMIYKNSELKQIVRFLEANKKDWLSDEQQEGEPFKVESYSHLLSLADKYFFIENK